MKTRVISGLCMVPLLAVIYFGGYPLIAAAFLVGLIGTRELFNGFKNCGINPSYKIAYFMLVLLYLLDYFFKGSFVVLTAWIVLGIVLSSIYIFNIKERKIEDGLGTMLGLIYVMFFSYHVVLIDKSPYNILIWLVFITAFGSDIFAYFTGYFLGKHKLCPNLSPKKTIEGAVGGVIGSALLSLGFGYLVSSIVSINLIHYLVIGVIASVLSMCGDLTASAYKRQMNIKDYGNLIPGHGGIMDRFDSVLFTAPAVYYYLVFVIMGNF